MTTEIIWRGGARLGRPRKLNARRNILKIRLSNAEYAAIRWRAGNKPISEWARNSLLACKPLRELDSTPPSEPIGHRRALREQIDLSRQERRRAREIRAATPETIFELAAELGSAG